MKYHETNAKHYVFTQLPEFFDGKRILVDIIKPFDVIVIKIIELRHNSTELAANRQLCKTCMDKGYSCKDHDLIAVKFRASAPVLYEIYEEDENAEIAVEKLGFKISQLFYRVYSNQGNADIRFQYRFLSNYFSLTIEK